MKKVLITLLLSGTYSLMGMEVASLPQAAAQAESEFITKSRQLTLEDLLQLQEKRREIYVAKAKEWGEKQAALSTTKEASLAQIAREKEAAQQTRTSEVAARLFFRRPFAGSIDFDAQFAPRVQEVSLAHQKELDALTSEYKPWMEEEAALEALVEEIVKQEAEHPKAETPAAPANAGSLKTLISWFYK